MPLEKKKEAEFMNRLFLEENRKAQKEIHKIIRSLVMRQM